MVIVVVSEELNGQHTRPIILKPIFFYIIVYLKDSLVKWIETSITREYK